MNSKYLYALSAALLLGMTACSSEDVLNQPGASDGETVFVSLTVDRAGAATRTIIAETDTEDGVGLSNKWAKGDKVTLVSTTGKVGTLTLEGEGGESQGVFSGNLSIASGDYAVWYLGAETPYASFADGATEPTNALAEEGGATVSGSFDDLNKGDLMKGSVNIAVNEGKATTTANVTLAAQMAMAHFTLSGDGIADALAAADASLTLAYGNYSYSIASPAADVYVPMIPGTYDISFTLSAAGSAYTCTFENKTLSAGLYYCGDKNSETGWSEGINVALESTPTEPQGDNDLVGKMFEVNGKKFRFTRANLKYTVDTGEWSLMDRQYSFICKGGWTLSNGTWAKAKEAEVDMFGFGATGLYDISSNETAQAPTFWRQTASQTYTLAAYYYPTNNTTTNQGAGFIGSNLEHGTQFTNFDWGKAYYLSKYNEAGPTSTAPYTSYDWAINPSHKPGDPEPLRYFTLSSDDWTKLQSKYFMTGATITGIANPVNTAAKNEIYGCLIFPITGEGANSAEINNDKLAKVKELLTGKVTYIDTKLTTNLNFTGTNYQYFKYNYVKMTAAQFDELEKYGVVFLPEAGHRAVESMTKDDGYYWTSTAGQQYVSTFFRFDGNSTTSVFKLEGINRSMGGSVRLVKEVPANYTDPVVVD